MMENTAENTASTTTANIAGHPLHVMVSGMPFTCFLGALLTDVAYAQTYDMQWANFSIWLLTAGLVTSVLAGITGIIDFAASKRVRAQRQAWPHTIGTTLAIILSLLNAFVHSRDGYTSVMPAGLTLSVLVVIILLVSNWFGSTLVYQTRNGVSN